MKTKQRVVVATCSDKKCEDVELKGILDRISKRKLVEMYGQITEDSMKYAQGSDEIVHN